MDGGAEWNVRDPQRVAHARLGVLRQRRPHLDRCPGFRMVEREPRGVEELPAQAVAVRLAVLGVADDRVADRQQVRADLMRAACLEVHFHQGCLAEGFQDFVVRNGRPAVLDHREAPVVARVASDRRRSDMLRGVAR